LRISYLYIGRHYLVTENNNKWPSSEKKRRAWRAFRETMDHYNEANTIVGSFPAITFSSSPKHIVGKVVVTELDFTCEISMLAKKLLTEEDHAYYLRYHTNIEREGFVPAPADMRNVALQERLGFAFIEQGLYPKSKYMQVIRK
jgi:hypothetical protein